MLRTTLFLILISFINLTSQESQVYIIDKVNKDTDKVINFSFEIDNEKLDLVDLLEKDITLINFWGTWCGPCRHEIPDLIQLQKKGYELGFQVIGVALERNTKLETIQSLEKFIDLRKINYRNFLAKKDIAFDLGLNGFIPTSIILNKKGEILEVIEGARTTAFFMESLKKYL